MTEQSDALSKGGQASVGVLGKGISRESFLRAVAEELIDHFRWTAVEGLVELEADSIALFAWHRALAHEGLVPAPPKPHKKTGQSKGDLGDDRRQPKKASN